MKTLTKLILGSALALSTHSFSQCWDAPALVEMDAKRIESVKRGQKSDFGYNFLGSKELEGELKNKCENRRLSVYFRNDEKKLNKNDTIDIQKYFSGLNSKVHYFQIRGYADVNGELGYNYNLALDRANKVAEKIKEKYPSVPIEIISVGESGSEENLAENRKVVAIPNEPSFYTDLQSSDADYFLLDLSGSMKDPVPGTGVPKYLFLREVKFPENSRLFGFFSGEIPKGEGLVSLKSFIPKGCSEIYGSAKDLIDKVVEEGKELQIFTDGISTDEFYTAQDVISSANKKDTKVSIVGVGIPKENVEDFLKVASETNGNYSVCTEK